MVDVINETVDKVKNHKLQSGKIIHVALSGSHAYGTSRPDSDVDVRGVFIIPSVNFLSFKKTY